MYLLYYIVLILMTSLCISKYCLHNASMSAILKKTFNFFGNFTNLWTLLPTFTIVMIAWLENRFDGFIPANDYTYLMINAEENIIPLFQQYNHILLTYLLGFFYVIVWPSLISTSFIVYNYNNDAKMVNILTLAYIFSYLTILPFHMFFPVGEVWASNVGVNLLLNDINVNIVNWLRPLSGMKNCFPSFHVGLSWTVTFASFFSHGNKYKRLQTFLIFSSCLITYSTLYLGIHWGLDVIAGICVAYAFFKVIKYAIIKNWAGSVKKLNIAFVNVLFFGE